MYSEAQKRYARSELGKLARKKYQSGEKAKLARARYMAKRRAKLIESERAEENKPVEKKEKPVKKERLQR